MKNLNVETHDQLHAKIEDLTRDMHEVLKNHGFNDVGISEIHFGPHVIGAPCGPPGAGTTWQYSCHLGVCGIVCK